MPMVNHFWRDADEPWVKVSGETRPRVALDPIVTDGSGGIEGVGDFGTTDLALIVGRVAPDSGEAVRLQFETD